MIITKEKFKELYYIKRDKELAELLGVKSVATIRKYARDLGLQNKGFGYMYHDDIRKKSKVNFK